MKSGIEGALDRHRDDLMSRPEVVGVGIGMSREGADGPCILVYCDKPVELPSTVEGYAVEQVIVAGGFTVD